MRHYIITHTLAVAAIVVTAFFMSCGDKDRQAGFRINGVWALQEEETPAGYKYQYPDNGTKWLRIYDDSCYYACRMTIAPNGTVIYPAAMNGYTFIDKGQGNILYLQEDNTNPLTIVSDSVMIIQESGWRYTWKLYGDINEKRRGEIMRIVRSDMESKDGEVLRYVFSDTEEELQSTNHALVYILVFVIVAFMLFMNYALNLYRNKKRVEQELRLIEQERETLPEPVRKAMDSVADEFHKSDFYLSLRRRISSGERLRKADWDAIEQQFQSVYPRFTSTLLSLYTMSQVEYQVCLLLKLNATPSEIADVLCKDTSSISSIRSRLYKKVFGKKGSSRDWDKFVLSL